MRGVFSSGMIPHRSRPALASLLLGLVALSIVFHAEVWQAYTVWLGSTAYNHCFLILPIAGWLFWDRRHRLRGLTPVPFWPAILLAALCATIWFIAERLGVMEGRQLAAMAMLQSLLLGVLGPTIYRAMIAPFLYLFFLVPFGGFLVPVLQNFTTHFVGYGLDLLSIPNYIQGNDIEIAQGTFRIAEACAGLRFLIAAIAFSVLYALLIFRTPGRRLLFIAISLMVPVIANGFRALGIVWLGHALGSAQAAATDHVLYGYLFFSLVLGMLILLGLPFREDHVGRTPLAPARVEPPHFGASATLLPAISIAMIALGTSFTGDALNRVAARGVVSLPPAFDSCQRLTGEASQQLRADGGRMEQFACAGLVRFTLVAFPSETDPKPVFEMRRLLGGENWREAQFDALVVAPNLPGWKLSISKDGRRVAASILMLDGRLTDGDLHSRVRMLWRDLTGQSRPAYVLAATTDGPAAAASLRLRAFIRLVYPDILQIGQPARSR